MDFSDFSKNEALDHVEDNVEDNRNNCHNCILEEDNRNNCIVEEEDNRNNCIIKDGQLEGTPISRRAGKVEVKVSQMRTRFNSAVFMCIENVHQEKCVHRKCASRKMSGQSG